MAKKITPPAASSSDTSSDGAEANPAPKGRALRDAYNASRLAEKNAEEALALRKIERRAAEHDFASKVGKGNAWEIDGLPFVVHERKGRMFFSPLAASAPDESILDD